MAEAAMTGLLDLEKELTCSVSNASSRTTTLPSKADRSLTLDLHRSPLPTSHPSRLSPHLLRLLPQGVVLMASLSALGL